VCPTGEAIRLVGNEKKLMVVHFLLDRPMRFNELLKLGLDSKTLSRILKGLEKNGLANRNVISTRPFAVQYSLTEMGTDLKPVLESFWVWANKWII
jgi:DNA-binding HxlR family transcriptional regulator